MCLRDRRRGCFIYLALFVGLQGAYSFADLSTVLEYNFDVSLYSLQTEPRAKYSQYMLQTQLHKYMYHGMP